MAIMFIKELVLTQANCDVGYTFRLLDLNIENLFDLLHMQYGASIWLSITLIVNCEQNLYTQIYARDGSWVVFKKSRSTLRRVFEQSSWQPYASRFIGQRDQA